MSNLELAKKLLKLYGISEEDGISFVEDRAFNDHRFASFLSVLCSDWVRRSYVELAPPLDNFVLETSYDALKVAGSDLHDGLDTSSTATRSKRSAGIS